MNTNKCKTRLDIGLAYEGKDKKKFEDSLRNVNDKLKKEGLYISLEESVGITIPFYLNYMEINRGIYHSFVNHHDHYFLWTNSSNLDMTLYSSILPPKNMSISIIDKSISESDDLDKEIYDTIQRYLRSDKPIYHPKPEHQMIYDNLYSEMLKSEKRTVGLTIISDRANNNKVLKLMEKTNEIYQKEFGINYDILSIKNAIIPEICSKEFESEIFKLRSTEPGEMHIILGERELKNKSTSGVSYPLYGLCWINSAREFRKVIHSIVHEIGHLFFADHVLLKDAIMHPENSKSLDTWSEYNRKIILLNKQRRWDKKIRC